MNQRELNRRGFLAGTAALAGSLAFAPQSLAAGPTPLRERAARCGVTYGCMVVERTLFSQPGLAEAVVREAAMVVPGIEMKWGVNQPRPEAPSYRAADRIAGFAAENGLALRGHTALWYRNLPDWAAREVRSIRGTEAMRRRVTDVIGHFRGRVAEWDVVNEAVEPKDGRDDMLRLKPMGEATSDDYVAEAFHVAREADPAALLFYNDYGVESSRKSSIQRRKGVLRLLTALKRRGAPVDGFGIQAHLIAGFAFDPEGFRQFLAEVAALDLRISITEFDVNDVLLDADMKERDQAAADYARAFLDAALDEPALRTVVGWGLSDHETWLDKFAPRKDKLPQRPLPLDTELARKPMWDAMAAAFDAAPQRAV